MRKLITLFLIAFSLSVSAQTYKTVTMALDTGNNVAKLRAGTQVYSLPDSLSKKANLNGGNLFNGDQVFDGKLSIFSTPENSTGNAFSLIRDGISGEVKQLPATSFPVDNGLSIAVRDTNGILNATRYFETDTVIRTDNMTSVMGQNGNGFLYKFNSESLNNFLGLDLQKTTDNGASTTNTILTERNTPAFSEYKFNSGVSGNTKVSVGMLGGVEANLSWNMDYTTGVHKYYDSTYNAMWLALGPDEYAMQYAPSGEPTSGDMWNSSGSGYLFWGTKAGRFGLNTSVGDDKGNDATGSQFFVKRNTGLPSISGFTDLVIEGNRIKGTSGNIYLNEYNTGTTTINKGGGFVGLGRDPLSKFHIQTAAGSSGGIRLDGFTHPTDISYWSESEFAMQFNGSFEHALASNAYSYLSLNNNFGIGYNSNQGYKLAVNGTGFFADKLSLSAGTTSAASFRMPNGVAPTSPILGDWWSLTSGRRTQTYDGTETKDVIFDKSNSLFADGVVGSIISDGAGNLSKVPIADRLTSNVIAKTANYTVTLSDVGANGEVLIRVDATAGNVTITLPVASTATGLNFIVKKTDASVNTVTVSVASTIDGTSTKVFNTQYSGARITSNGTTYSITGSF